MVDQVDKYDVMVIYIQSIPTFSFCKDASFGWRIFDFEHNLIDKGRFTVKEIDGVPHFVDDKKKE